MAFVDYIQYTITIAPVPVADGIEITPEERQEIIISELSELPFESFETGTDHVWAYIQAGHDADEFISIIHQLEGVIQIEKKRIPGENWNKVWEESFEPITIGADVIIRAPFHIVDKTYTHEIIIEPKMSFGTGHHATTRLMMETMLTLHFTNRSVLDMGCGTGILAILAAKLGADFITAADNDPQCIENTTENIASNHCPQIEVCLNDKISANFKTDIILANIQKNVLMEQMPLYKSWLNTGGQLLVSGIYEEAIPGIRESAARQGLRYARHAVLNGWCMVRFDN